MKRRDSGGKLPRRASSGVVDSREFLERIGRILVLSGRTPQELSQEFEKVCGLLEQPNDRWDPERFGFVSDLPHVIARWHDDEHYLDARGQPIPLPLTGRGRSLRSLAKLALPSLDPARVVEALINLGGVRRHGRGFVPIGRYLALNSHRTIALAHGLNALLGMLRTVEHNLSVGPDRRLFERTAINPRFPASALPRFQREFARRAGEMMWDFDVDMRREEARRRSGRMMRLGVGLYMFEDVPGRTRRRRAGTGRRSALTLRRRRGRRPP